MSLSAAKIAGSNAARGRVTNDYYATPFHATEAILDKLSDYDLGDNILEPAAGEGHIVKVLTERFPNKNIIANDLEWRNSRFGFNIQGDVDFLTYEPECEINTVITNPPFSLAQHFIEKGLQIAKKYVIILAKIQLLEGEKRKLFFENNPPHYIYVFSKRCSTLRNGEEIDENGKKITTVLCLAWYVWEVGYKGETIVRWI